MSTRFVLRSPYLPANRSICRLDARSPLDWFRSVWPRLRRDATITSKALLDVEDLYGFGVFADHVRSNELAAPTASDDLQTLLKKNWYSNNVECRDGFVLVETDDDEVELAFWWVSDEVFLTKQELFACYATDPLPTEIGGGGFDPGYDIAVADAAGGEGAVFCMFATVWDSGNLSDLPGPVEVRGLRLPGFADWLRAMPSGLSDWLEAMAGRSGYWHELDWLALVARHNAELDLPALLRRLAEVSPYSASEHGKEIRKGTLSENELRKDVRWLGSKQPTVLVQGSANSIEFRLYDGFSWHVWFLFDDLWASAHPVLARSLLRFGMPITGL
jgi:hypothetical protein